MDRIQRVSQEIVYGLAESGTSVMHGVMGDGNMRMIVEVHRAGMRYVAARHENGAVAMADGFARASGTVGIATTTQGPGFTNALTALMTAQRARTPLVLLTGYLPMSGPWNQQQLGQVDLLNGLGITTCLLGTSDASRGTLASVELAKRHSCPVVVQIPNETWQDHPNTTFSSEPREYQESDRNGDLDEQISKLAARVAASRRIVILAGRGAYSEECGALLGRLADKTGADLATSLMAKGLFTGHPRDLGVIGTFASDRSATIVKAADLVIVFGASLNPFTTQSGELFSRGAEIVQIDRDSTAIGSLQPVAQGILGDTATVARHLLDAVATDSASASGRAAVHPEADAGPGAATNASAELDPTILAKHLNRVLPKSRTVVSDGGLTMGHCARHIDVGPGPNFFFLADFGSIALGLPASIGAAIARPSNTTVLMVGDGALAMSLTELETLAREQLPVIVVVFDDGAYGIEYHNLDIIGLDKDTAVYGTVDFAAVARALGIRAMTIRQESDLIDVEGFLAETNGPRLLDCKIDRAVRSNWL